MDAFIQQLRELLHDLDTLPQNDDIHEPTPPLAPALLLPEPPTHDTPDLFVIISMSTYDKKTFVLPEGEWKVRVDTQSFYDTSDFLSQQADTSRSYNVYYSDPATVTDAYEAQPRTVVILSK